ncbi:MAG: hypothetical protein ACK414_14480, partial [Gemmobacter sp.]
MTALVPDPAISVIVPMHDVAPQAGAAIASLRAQTEGRFEAIGIDDPALDAEVIAVADEAFRSLGLAGFRLELTSLGDDSCRPAYRERL